MNRDWEPDPPYHFPSWLGRWGKKTKEVPPGTTASKHAELGGTVNVECVDLTPVSL